MKWFALRLPALFPERCRLIFGSPRPAERKPKPCPSVVKVAVSWDRPNARRCWWRTLKLDGFFGGDGGVTMTEIGGPDGFLGLALKILNRRRLMPRPDFRAHERVRRQQHGGFAAQPRHDRVETKGASVKIRETNRSGSEQIKRIGRNRGGNAVVARTHINAGSSKRDIGG